MIYILGAGGFARETLNIYADSGKENEVVGFLEDNCQRKGELLNGKPIDDTAILKELNKDNVELVCAIGTPLRKGLIEYTKKLGYKYDVIVHPSVIKSRWVTFGKGCIICAGNIFTNQITVGEYTIINLDCTIGHDVVIGRYTTISPGVHISGVVSIGDGCFIGTGAVIIEKVTIGKGSFIGAGTVVSENIPENVLALGVPAKPIRKLTESDWKELL
jgi:sugar O-acyltransferase (sialic acid O-acetyltransferase NeuD family)